MSNFYPLGYLIWMILSFSTYMGWIFVKSGIQLLLRITVRQVWNWISDAVVILVVADQCRLAYISIEAFQWIRLFCHDRHYPGR